MKVIIKIEHEDGTADYVQEVGTDIKVTEEEGTALVMDFNQAMRISLALGTLGIRHSLIRKQKFETE